MRAHLVALCALAVSSAAGCAHRDRSAAQEEAVEVEGRVLTEGADQFGGDPAPADRERPRCRCRHESEGEKVRAPDGPRP